MQTASSRAWPRVAASISIDRNNCTTSISKIHLSTAKIWIQLFSFSPLLYTTAIIITTLIQYKYRQTLSFQMLTDLLIPSFGQWRHEERHTIPMLTIQCWPPPQLAAYLNSSQSVEIRKTQARASSVESPTGVFQNPQILRTISSWHDGIHTPVPFPVWGFIMTNGDCHNLCERV